jgi:hypothetical protein
MESSSLVAATIHFARPGGQACNAWATSALDIKRKSESLGFML